MPPLSIVMLVAGTRGDVQVRPLSLLCGTQTPMHVAFRWAWGAGGVAVRLPSLLRSKNAAMAPAWTMWKELPRAVHVGGLLPAVWQGCGLTAGFGLGLSFGIESWPLCHAALHLSWAGAPEVWAPSAPGHTRRVQVKGVWVGVWASEMQGMSTW